jgi:hypothetical protein
MDYKQLLKHFGGSLTETAAALQRPTSTVFFWKAHGIPRGVQFEIQVLTGGKLRASPGRPRRFAA